VDLHTSQVSAVAGLYLDGGALLAYAGHPHLGAVLTVLGLDLHSCQILLSHPHSQTLQSPTQPQHATYTMHILTSAEIVEGTGKH